MWTRIGSIDLGRWTIVIQAAPDDFNAYVRHYKTIVKELIRTENSDGTFDAREINAFASIQFDHILDAVSDAIRFIS